MSRPSASSPKRALARGRAASWKMSPIDEPRDALALQAGHQIDFFTGNSRMLRDRIARAMPAWYDGMPGYHAMLGMQAFGLEEMGDYARAEALGRAGDRARAARRLGAARGGACHGNAEPAARRHRLDARQYRALDEGELFQVHNWWHLALFHYDLGEIDEVLALFDGPIYGAPSTLALNMIDASAMLWRLHLGGVDVGDRWAGACRQLGAEGRATATTPSTTCTR